MTSGIYTLDLGGANDTVSKCLLQSDGKIVLIGSVSGNFAATRLSISGVLDQNFGTNGLALVDFGANDIALSAGLQSDGKIIISGSTAWGTPNSDLALARLQTNGLLDSTFGLSGKTSVDFSQYDTADGIAVQSDGKFVIGGHSYYKNNDDFICMRLNANGSIDSGFGYSGLINIDLGSGDFGYSVVVQPDKSILIAGRSGGAFGIVKLLPNGQLDTNFGQGGKTIIGNFSVSDVVKISTSLVDGKIYIAGDTGGGSSNRDFAISRLNIDGSLDLSFGNHGQATFDVNGRNDYLSDLILNSDGKIFLTGTSNGDFSAVRLNSNSTLDSSFGSNGICITDLGSLNDTSYAAALQSDGKLLLAGTSNGNYAVVRYTQQGNLDKNFGNLPTYSLLSSASVVDEGQKFVVTLNCQNIDAGTLVPYKIDGVSTGDLVSNSLNGSFSINENGTSNIEITISEDQLTEGTEVLHVSAGNASVDVSITDTSKALTPVIREETHVLSVIVDQGILSLNPVYLKGINEKFTFSNNVLISHLVEYAGITYDYTQIDSLVITVTRDDEFTSEFTKEINDYVHSDLNIKYQAAIAIVGVQNMNNTILVVAGSDGNYVD